MCGITVVKQMTHSSTLTLQMFIACRGLPVLVGFLEMDYTENRNLVLTAIDGIDKVFKLKVRFGSSHVHSSVIP